jgi:prophage maintenance system killer protein
LGAIFHQGLSGYVHLPLEKMAGLLLHRISQGQYFFDGNKRTGVLACAIFLQNHGLQLKLDRVQVAELVWGFAAPMDGSLAKYGEDDAIQFVFDNVLPRS